MMLAITKLGVCRHTVPCLSIIVLLIESWGIKPEVLIDLLESFLRDSVGILWKRLRTFLANQPAA